MTEEQTKRCYRKDRASSKVEIAAMAISFILLTIFVCWINL
jgi:hypothetical protein